MKIATTFFSINLWHFAAHRVCGNSVKKKEEKKHIEIEISTIISFRMVSCLSIQTVFRFILFIASMLCYFFLHHFAESKMRCVMLRKKKKNKNIITI
jgi:hypothetical protein